MSVIVQVGDQLYRLSATQKDLIESCSATNKESRWIQHAIIPGTVEIFNYNGWLAVRNSKGVICYETATGWHTVEEKKKKKEKKNEKKDEKKKEKKEKNQYESSFSDSTSSYSSPSSSESFSDSAISYSSTSTSKSKSYTSLWSLLFKIVILPIKGIWMLIKLIFKVIMWILKLILILGSIR